MYPGIPPDFVKWPKIQKRVWIDNYANVSVTLRRMARNLDESTKDGVYNAILATTGDEHEASKARSQAWAMQKLAAISTAAEI